MPDSQTNNKCPLGAHGAVIVRIEHLEGDNKTQWEMIKDNRLRVDKILTRINVLLGGVITGCVLLLLNLIKDKL